MYSAPLKPTPNLCWGKEKQIMKSDGHNMILTQLTISAILNSHWLVGYIGHII